MDARGRRPPADVRLRLRRLTPEPITETRSPGRGAGHVAGAPCSLVEHEGRRWQAISQAMGRTPANCRDRFRDLSVKDRRRGTHGHGSRGGRGEGARLLHVAPD
jgi:hypothetical protein